MKDNMNVADILRKEALDKGANCKIITEWDNPDNDTLIQKYIEGIDFCIDKDFPDNKFIKKYFDGDMQKHGVFVDEKIDLHNIPHVILNGKCRGVLKYDGYRFGKIYVRHKSKVIIEITDKAIVNVEIYDKASVVIKNKGEKNAAVYLYGGEIECTSGVKVFDKTR